MVDIHTRRMTAADTAAAAAMMTAQWPVPAKLARVLPRLLAGLMGARLIAGVCLMELDPDGLEKRIAAFGLSAFTGDGWIADYLGRPFPYLALGLLGRAADTAGASDFLSPEEVAAANAGLRFLSRLAAPPAVTAAGCFPSHGRVLFSISREDVREQLPGSAMGALFEYRQPRCRFTPKMQDVLLAAVEGMTDERIADLLGVPHSTVRERWRAIYQLVQKYAPGVFARLEDRESRGGRGLEKRLHVVGYVREHPEELRPYKWD